MMQSHKANSETKNLPMRSSDFTESHTEKSYCYEIEDFVLQSMDYTFSSKNPISNILK